MDKIFGIGLSRTGTRSLAYALKILGYKSVHYRNEKDGEIINTKHIYGNEFDAYTDTPISFRFEELAYSFPDAKFIYTTRALSDWVCSVKRHLYAETPKNMGIEPELYLEAIHRNLYKNYSTWQEAYLAHLNRVTNFFSKWEYLDDKLLHLNISSPDKWESLCKFLDKPIPSVPYPHYNKFGYHFDTNVNA